MPVHVVLNLNLCSLCLSISHLFLRLSFKKTKFLKKLFKKKEKMKKTKTKLSPFPPQWLVTKVVEPQTQMLPAALDRVPIDLLPRWPSLSPCGV